MTANERRKIRYLNQLRRCGFRSWVRANERRCQLIDDCDGPLWTPCKAEELAELQKLADLYLAYKCPPRRNGVMAAAVRKLRMMGVDI